MFSEHAFAAWLCWGLVSTAAAPPQGHGKPVDWWAFGVLLFEMVAGYPPFYDEDITATYKKILAGRMAFPAHVSVTCRDLIRRLLKACRWLPKWADSATNLGRADVCCAT